MKVTTIRFGWDLWGLLESEAARVGVSVSQYIREAALARAASAAAVRNEEPFEKLAAVMDDTSASAEARSERAPGTHRSEAARQRSSQNVREAQALKAESTQALRRAAEVLERTQKPRRG